MTIRGRAPRGKLPSNHSPIWVKGWSAAALWGTWEKPVGWAGLLQTEVAVPCFLWERWSPGVWGPAAQGPKSQGAQVDKAGDPAFPRDKQEQ